MAASSSGVFTTPFLSFRIRRFHDDAPFLCLRRRSIELFAGRRRHRRLSFGAGGGEREKRFRCSRCSSSSSDSVVHSKRHSDKCEELRRFDTNKSVRRGRSRALPSLPFASSQYVFFFPLSVPPSLFFLNVLRIL